MAINDYLTEIRHQRDNLKENLQIQEVSVIDCHTFNSLIPKVLDIVTHSKSNAQNGVWTPTITEESFKIYGLDFIPAKISICCEDVLTKKYTSVTPHINLAIVNIELTSKDLNLITNNIEAGSVSIDTSDIAAEITVEKINEKYNVGVSFSEINKTLEIPYKFKANASHIWCVVEEGWLI